VERERGYPSDLTDEQWALIEPMLPSPKWFGRPEVHPRRSIVDAILYVVRTGCSWRQLPVDFPPWPTVYWHFGQLNARGITERILDELRELVRLDQGRQAEPTAGIIDSQSVKGADTVGKDTRGWDAGKRVNGRKRLVLAQSQ
jgi:transposase